MYLGTRMDLFISVYGISQTKLVFIIVEIIPFASVLFVFFVHESLFRTGSATIKII